MKFHDGKVSERRVYRHMLMCPSFRYPADYYFDSVLSVEEYAAFLHDEGYEFSLDEYGWSFTVEPCGMMHVEGEKYE